MEELYLNSEQRQSYEKPVMEITLFETEDIITTSGDGSDEDIELLGLF